jgi:hypothetical protein
MSQKIWEINTSDGFVCCVGYTKRQAIELILKKIIQEQDKLEEQQEQKKISRRKKLIRLN